MDSNIRLKAKSILGNYLQNKQNIELFEKNIFQITNDNIEEKDINSLYLSNIYEVINYISNGYKLKDIFQIIKENKLNWNNESFKQIKYNEEEENNFIIKPFEIEEGVLQCKCGSKRVFSFQKQTRGADEPSTTFAECAQCKKSWIYNG